MRMRNIRMLAAAATLAVAASSRAAYTFTTFNTPVTETFTNYDGSAAPANFTVAGQSAFRGQNAGASNTNGAYAYGSGSDYSLGFLASSSATTSATATTSIVNSTGAAITQLTLSYDAEEWRVGGRPSSFAVTYAINGGAAVAIPALNYSAIDTSGGTNGVAGTGASTTLSTNLTGLNIPVGQSLTLTWTYTGNGDGSGAGARSGISIDNIAATPISTPEPTAMVAMPAMALMTLRRRRQA